MSLSNCRTLKRQCRGQRAFKHLVTNSQDSECMAGPRLRLQCPGAIYEAMTGKGKKLPYLLIVCCGDAQSADVVACPDLTLDYEASSAACFAL